MMLNRNLILDKGYLVLPPYYRIIQGYGVDETSIGQILQTIEDNGYSASNVGFGMGGALLQRLDRDTQRFAYKCSAAQIDGKWIDVSKNPKSDPSKASKGGRLDLVLDGKSMSPKFRTVQEGQGESVLQTVFENGERRGSRILLDVVREQVNEALRAAL